MHPAIRITIAFFSFVGALIFAVPNLTFMFMVGLYIIGKYVSGVFCFIFAFNIAKIVESAYRKQLDENENKSDNESNG